MLSDRDGDLLWDVWVEVRVLVHVMAGVVVVVVVVGCFPCDCRVLLSLVWWCSLDCTVFLFWVRFCNECFIDHQSKLELGRRFTKKMIKCTSNNVIRYRS